MNSRLPRLTPLLILLGVSFLFREKIGGLRMAPDVSTGECVRLARAICRELYVGASGDFGEAPNWRREARELAQPEPRVHRGVVVHAAEELRRGHVVIDEHLPRGQLRELVEHLVAHREVEDEQVRRLHRPEEPPVRQDSVGAGLRLSAELLGPEYSMQWNSLDSGLTTFFSREVAGAAGEDLVEKQNAEVGLMPVVPDEALAYGYTDEDRHFCRAFLGLEEPRLTFADGLEVVEILMTAYKSAEEGRTLEFDREAVEGFVPRVGR